MSNAQSEPDLNFRTLLETAPIAIVVINSQGQIETVNQATETLFGYERTELLGQSLEMLLPPRLRYRHHHHRKNYFAEPRVRSMGVGLDLVGMKKDSSEFPLEIALSYITPPDGVKAIAFITDSTSRHEHEAEATQNRLRAELVNYATDLEQKVHERTQEIERRRAVAEGLKDILTVLNSNQPLQTTLATIMVQATRLFEAPAAIVVEQGEAQELTIVAKSGISEAVTAGWRGQVGEGMIGLTVQRALPFASDDLVTHTHKAERLPLKNGAPSRALLTVPLIVSHNVYGALALYYAAPHHFSAEEIDLALSFGQQAALAIENARLRQDVATNAVAAERSRLARDLHDSVTQTLFAASLTADVLPVLWERSPTKGRERLQDLRQLTKSALAEMRTLLYELRPQVLTRTPIRELLEQLGEALRARAQIEVTVVVDVVGTLPPEVQMAFYRIAQEASNNISKHAQAHHAHFHLEPRAIAQDGWRLTIQDDGIGFDIEQQPTTTLGLDIMQERAETIRATLRVVSQPDTGTTIVVEWTGATYESPT